MRLKYDAESKILQKSVYMVFIYPLKKKAQNVKTSSVPRRVTATDALGIGTGSRGALEPLVVTLGMATVLTHAAHNPELGDS